jgi:hypothetical protein
MWTEGHTWHPPQQFTSLTWFRKHINTVMSAKIRISTSFLKVRQVLCPLLQIYATWRRAGLNITASCTGNAANWRMKVSPPPPKYTAYGDCPLTTGAVSPTGTEMKVKKWAYIYKTYDKRSDDVKTNTFPQKQYNVCILYNALKKCPCFARNMAALLVNITVCNSWKQDGITKVNKLNCTRIITTKNVKVQNNVQTRLVFLVSWDGVRLSPLGTSPTNWPIVPAPDDNECGAVDGMRIGKGNRSTRRKPTPVPLRPPQIQHDLTWARTRAAVVGSRRLTAWAMARPTAIRAHGFGHRRSWQEYGYNFITVWPLQETKNTSRNAFTLILAEWAAVAWEPSNKRTLSLAPSPAFHVKCILLVPWVLIFMSSYAIISFLHLSVSLLTIWATNNRKISVVCATRVYYL